MHDRCDPLCLDDRTLPVPVAGDLPPAICLVDDDGPFPLERPIWFRGLAAALAAAFAASSILASWGTAAPREERGQAEDPAPVP